MVLPGRTSKVNLPSLGGRVSFCIFTRWSLNGRSKSAKYTIPCKRKGDIETTAYTSSKELMTVIKALRAFWGRRRVAFHLFLTIRWFMFEGLTPWCIKNYRVHYGFLNFKKSARNSDVDNGGANQRTLGRKISAPTSCGSAPPLSTWKSGAFWHSFFYRVTKRYATVHINRKVLSICLFEIFYTYLDN